MSHMLRPCLLTVSDAQRIVDALQVQVDAYRDELDEAETVQQRKTAQAELRRHDATIRKIREAFL